jgi:hypothetical protein
MFSHRIPSVAVVLFAVVVASLAAARLPAAEPDYRVAVQTRSGRNQPPVSHVPQSVASSYYFTEPTYPANSKIADAFAAADPGQAETSVHVTTYYPNAIPSLGPNLGGHSALADVSFQLYDLIIINEANPSEVGSVQGTFSIELAGYRSTNAVAIGGTGSACAGSSVFFSANLNFPNAIIIPGTFVPDPGVAYGFSGAIERDSCSNTSGGGFQGQEGRSGLLADGFDGHEVFTNATRTLPVGAPFWFDARLNLGADVSADRSGQAAPSEFRYAEGAAGFELGFPTNVDLFNLPPGYTVRSESGHITNNRYTLSTIGEPGDMNRDGDVNSLDVAQFLPHLGRTTGSIQSSGDLNGDHATTLDDLAILQSHLGAAVANSPLSSAQPIPEPQSLALLVLAVLAIACKWRRRRSLPS